MLPTKYKFGKSKHQLCIAMLVVVMLTIISGFYLLNVSQAATQSIGVEAETGSIVNPAIRVADSTASNGSSVKFSSGSNNCVSGYTNLDCQLRPTKQGMLFGSTTNDAVAANPWNRKMDIVRIYQTFGDASFPNVGDAIYSAANNSQIPLVSLHAHSGGIFISWSGIAAGANDIYLTDIANKFAAYYNVTHKPVMFSFAHEPEGEPSGNAVQYQAAFRHIHDLFSAKGATHVQWIMILQNQSFTNGAANSFYPGDAYVDWIGLPAQNRGALRANSCRACRCPFRRVHRDRVEIRQQRQHSVPPEAVDQCYPRKPGHVRHDVESEMGHASRQLGDSRGRRSGRR